MSTKKSDVTYDFIGKKNMKIQKSAKKNKGFKKLKNQNFTGKIKYF